MIKFATPDLVHRHHAGLRVPAALLRRGPGVPGPVPGGLPAPGRGAALGLHVLPAQRQHTRRGQDAPADHDAGWLVLLATCTLMLRLEYLWRTYRVSQKRYKN